MMVEMTLDFGSSESLPDIKSCPRVSSPEREITPSQGLEQITMTPRESPNWASSTCSISANFMDFQDIYASCVCVCA